MQVLAFWSSWLVSFLGFLVLLQILAAPVVALYLVTVLRGRVHRRYDAGEIYADLRGAQYHVPREILELYMHRRDTRIEDVPGPPETPREFSCWGWVVLVPRVFARVAQPFDAAEKNPSRSRRASTAPSRAAASGGATPLRKKSAEKEASSTAS